MISLDIFITVLYSLLVFSSQSANFHDFILTQSSYWYIIIYAPAASCFVVVLFLESKRAPFDHAETESEVVAGYSTEYNGPMLLLIFLCEYLHVVISAIHFIIFFAGGWFSMNLFSLSLPIFLSYHDTLFYSTVFSSLGFGDYIYLNNYSIFILFYDLFAASTNSFDHLINSNTLFIRFN